MERWNTTNSASKGKFFAQVRIAMHEFKHLFIMVSDVHVVDLIPSSNIMVLANSSITSRAKMPLNCDSS